MYAAIIGAALQQSAANQQDLQLQQAQKRGFTQDKAMLQELLRLLPKQRYMGALQEAQIRKGQKDQLAGFAGANQAIGIQGRQARQDAADVAKQTGASLEQGIVSQGLQGTTIGQSAVSSLGDQTSRQLADIDASLAQAYAQLGIAEGGVKNQQAQELAGFMAQRETMDTDLEREIAAVRAAIKAQDKLKTKKWKKYARYAGADPLGLFDPELKMGFKDVK